MGTHCRRGQLGEGLVGVGSHGGRGRQVVPGGQGGPLCNDTSNNISLL